MKKYAFYPIFICIFLVYAFVAKADDVHTHGIAIVNIVIEEPLVIVELDSPLNTVLGFEHPPKTEKERAAAKKMVDYFNKAGDIFLFSPEAKCTLNSVELETDKDNPDLATLGNEKRNHEDLEADFIFSCADPQKLNSVEILLFKEFAGLKSIKAQVITEKGQKSAELTPNNRKLNW